MAAAPAPKIELHVHLEGAVRPRALLEIAARNGVSGFRRGGRECRLRIPPRFSATSACFQRRLPASGWGRD